MSSALYGRQIVVTREASCGDPLKLLLADRGAEVLSLPAIEILPTDDWTDADQALQMLSSFDMVLLGSLHAARFLAERAEFWKLSIDLPVACVGRKTQQGLTRNAQLRRIFQGLTTSPAEFRSEALAEHLVETYGTRLSTMRFLLPRTPRGRTHLSDRLEREGAHVHSVNVYEVRSATPPDPALVTRAAGADAITFLSGETLRRFLEIVPQARNFLDKMAVAVIGPVAQEKAAKLGVTVDLMPKEASLEALVDVLCDHFGP